jgi:thiol-disulfide isomerase/thioredoxin
MVFYKRFLTGDNMRKFAAISFTILLLVSMGCGQSSKPSTIPADAKKLNMTLTDVNGNVINMRQHLGKVVIIDFWDTWCGPCKMEIPHFVDLYSQYKDKGLVIVGVAFGRNGVQAVKDMGSQLKINYVSTLFNEEAKAIFGAPNAIPTTYIIDQSGEIVDKVVGARDRSYFEGKIKSLLKIS